MDKQKKNEDRFTGLRGDEYQYLKNAYPHYDEFQGAIGRAVTEHTQTGMNILELGTGTGSTLIPLLNILEDADVQVHALDISSGDLEIATEAASDTRVHTITADMFKILPLLQENSFDVICTGWTLHNFTEDKRGFLFTHIKRILKDGGTFVNGDRFAYGDEELQNRMINEQLELYQEHLPAKLCKGWSEHILEDEKWKFTEAEQQGYFPNGHFVFRERNEGVFVGINSK